MKKLFGYEKYHSMASCRCGRSWKVHAIAEEWVKGFKTSNDAIHSAKLMAFEIASKEDLEGYSCCVWNCVAGYIVSYLADK